MKLKNDFHCIFTLTIKHGKMKIFYFETNKACIYIYIIASKLLLKYFECSLRIYIVQLTISDDPRGNKRFMFGCGFRRVLIWHSLKYIKSSCMMHFRLVNGRKLTFIISKIRLIVYRCFSYRPKECICKCVTMDPCFLLFNS